MKGLREFQAALRKADRETKRHVRAVWRKTAEPIRNLARAKFSGVDARVASKFRVAVRAAGVSVEQPARKTTGMRPNFGELQMRRALIPALEEKRDDYLDAMDNAAEEIADIVRRA